MKQQLPPDVLVSDTKYPKGPMARDIGDYGRLTFYNVISFGWCIAHTQCRQAQPIQNTSRDLTAPGN